MSNFFKSFKTEKPAFQSLTEGSHLVRISRVELITSFQKYDGSPKEKLPEWQNATPQLAVTVIAAEDGKSGAMTHRFNGCGFIKYDDLTTKQVKSGKFEEINGYACYVDKDNDTIRLESEEKTIACQNILNQFAAALQIKEGSDLMEALAVVIAEQTTFRADVTKEDYEGKDQYRLAKFKAVTTVKAQQFED